MLLTLVCLSEPVIALLVCAVALSESVMEIPPKIGAEATVTHILPLILQFLRDEAVEVRLAALAKLTELVNTAGADSIQQGILPTAVALGADPQWRIREKVVQQLPVFARKMVRDHLCTGCLNH